MSSDLDQRRGWPDELRVLLERYPRDTWIAHPSGMARFWLEIHDGFRNACVALQTTTDGYRDERTTAEEFAVLVNPRLRGMISHLHGHHQIEDYHYFPSFRAAEARLSQGFDTLESDHRQLALDITAAIAALNALVTAAHTAGSDTSAAKRHAAERYVAASELLYRRLCRHLSDEEDLIIPVMLDHGS